MDDFKVQFKATKMKQEKWNYIFPALSRIPAPVRGAQCATQAGLEGLAVCLRHELKPRGVDVSVVSAGEFAAGTAWLSESSMLEQVYRHIWIRKTKID